MSLLEDFDDSNQSTPDTRNLAEIETELSALYAELAADAAREAEQLQRWLRAHRRWAELKTARRAERTEEENGKGN